MKNKRIDYCLWMIREDTHKEENKIHFTLHILNFLHILKNKTKDLIFELKEYFLKFKKL